MVCYDKVKAAPTVLLGCGHALHAECVRGMLRTRWTTPRITFGFMGCPLCKTPVAHPAFEELLTPLHELHEKVRTKAFMRLKYEGKQDAEAITAPGGKWHGRPKDYAEDLYAYYECYKCKEPYYGGERACGAAGDGDFNPQDLICGSCQPGARDQVCSKHGTDYIEFKCRYCCSIAVWYCHGTTHYCDPCHSGGARAGPCPWRHGKAIEGATECPLGIDHPPAGEEFALGCGICRNEATF